MPMRSPASRSVRRATTRRRCASRRSNRSLRSRRASMASVLSALVHDQDVDVACAAIAAIAKFDADGAEPALRFALDSHDPRMLHAALQALGCASRRTCRADPHAIARESRDDDLRRDAVLTLGRIGGRAAIAGACRPLARSEAARIGEVALGSLDAGQLASLRLFLADANERRRRVVVDALSRTKNESAAVVLAAALDDLSPSVRLAAARALGRLDLRDARAQLAALARTDENIAVRLAAQDAPVEMSEPRGTQFGIDVRQCDVRASRCGVRTAARSDRSADGSSVRRVEARSDGRQALRARRGERAHIVSRLLLPAALRRQRRCCTGPR